MNSRREWKIDASAGMNSIELMVPVEFAPNIVFTSLKNKNVIASLDSEELVTNASAQRIVFMMILLVCVWRDAPRIIKHGSMENVPVDKENKEMKKDFVILLVESLKRELMEYVDVSMGITRVWLVHVLRLHVHLDFNGIRLKDNVEQYVQVPTKY